MAATASVELNEAYGARFSVTAHRDSALDNNPRVRWGPLIHWQAKEHDATISPGGNLTLAICGALLVHYNLQMRQSECN